MTIKEVMNSASQEQRNLVIAAIVNDGVAISTAYCYCNGSRKPKHLYRVNIQKYIKKYVGVSVPLPELFPE